MNHMITR